MASGDFVLANIDANSTRQEIFRTDSVARVFIGSDPKADICVANDSSIQPMHVQLDIDPPNGRLQVLAGRPLVRVNRRMCTQSTLKLGDQFIVGRTLFEVCQSNAINHLGETLDAETGETDKTMIVEDTDRVPDDRPRVSEPVAVAPPGYRIVRCIGQGAMGVVYEAIHLAKQTRVAIKFLHPSGASSEQSMRLFLREASLLSQLKHPRIVQFHEMGWIDGRVFFAMEYVDTIELVKMLSAVSPNKRIRVATGIVCQVLDALNYAHSHRVVHRDVKPSNILVYRDAKGLQARLGDFGLAKNFENAGFSGMTTDGEIRGTMAFMAPEQFRDSLHAKPASDLFSAGATLFYLLSDHYPLPKVKSVVERLSSLDSQPMSLRLVVENAPAGLAEILEKSMQPDPAARFRTAREMRDALYPFTKTGKDTV